MSQGGDLGLADAGVGACHEQAAGDLLNHHKSSGRGFGRDARPQGKKQGCFSSKITLLLFIFHRTGLVVIDEPTLPLRGGGQQHFLNDFRQRVSSGFDGAG